MSDSFEKSVVQLLGLAAIAIPLTLAILNGASDPYWLDSPEFTAAVQTLGIPHPPGHPLYVMLVKPFTLLPFGTIGLRVTIASAVFGAVAALLLFKISLTVLQHVTDSVPLFVNALIALCVSLLASVSHAWWFQSVRQEVYSLQIMLVLGALLPVIQYTLIKNRTAADKRLLYAASFIFGLGLANHHFIMLVALPAAIPALVSVVSSKGERQPAVAYLKMAFLGLAGIAPYLFLPIRSMNGAAVALGGVHSISDFFWVISAKVYQKSMTRETGNYLQDGPMDAIFSIMGELGPVLVVAAFIGIYLLIRRKSTRLTGITVFLAAGVTLLMRSLMGFDPFNPDYFGYVLPTIALCALAAGVFVSVALHVLYRSLAYAPMFAPLLAIALFALPISKARTTKHSTDLSDFHVTRTFFDFAVMDTPPQTVVIAHYYKLFFSLWSARYIDGSRPDVHVVNPQLLGYPGYLASVTRQTPELKTLAWSIFVKRAITEKAISDLAQQHPLRIDPSAWTDEKARKHLLPNGLLYQAFSEPISRTDVVAAREQHFAKWKKLYTGLGTNWEEHETWRFLSWSHYMDAIYFASMGAREAAQQSIQLSIGIGAATAEISGLEDALKTGEGPVDVTPFLLGQDAEKEKEADNKNRVSPGVAP